MSFETVMQPYNSSDPSASFVASSALDFLLIELVPLAYRVTTEASASEQGEEPEDYDATAEKTTKTTADTAAAATVTSPTSFGRMDEDEALDAVQHKLESTGYRVGQGLVERFSRDRPRFNDSLDVIKFLCKDFWSLVFGKNIDNLKTNHRGVYVLTDNVFRPFSRMSTEPGGQAVVRAQPFLWFPCGIVRGALAALGTEATVQAEVTDLPAAVFQIKTVPVKP